MESIKTEQMNKQNKKENKLIDTENRLVVARREGDGWWDKQVKVIKRYKILVIKSISHGDLMYIMVTIVNNIVLHIL